MQNDVLGGFATQHLKGLVVRVISGADWRPGDSSILFSEAF